MRTAISGNNDRGGFSYDGAPYEPSRGAPMFSELGDRRVVGPLSVGGGSLASGEMPWFRWGRGG